MGARIIAASMLKEWIRLSRPEFHTVGVFPLLLGVALGFKAVGYLTLVPTVLALLCVILVMLATYWSGEVFDYEVDVLSAQMERNRFSGGTLVLQGGGIDRRTAFVAASVAFVLAGVLGLYLSLGLGYGPELFAVGALVSFMGFFYTTPPFRWAYRGVGEIFIAISYGWVPVAVGYYLHTRSWDILPIILYGTPVALSIFMVILINEFPDYPADRLVGKRNLVVRLGRERAAVLYALAGFLFTLSVLIPALLGYGAFLPALPAIALAVWNVSDVLRGRWRDRKTLERLCARTILLNVGTTLLLILGVVLS